MKSRNKSGLFLTRAPYPKKDGNANYFKNTEDEMIKITESTNFSQRKIELKNT